MRTLSIDIETFSSIDLIESGVYKYVEAPDFDILLFAYAFDDEPVEIIDLTKEWLPPALEASLTDSDITKSAFNANFERTCLSRYLDIHLPVEQWECTMVHSLMMGLPGSLEMVAKALNLEQQKGAGKPLISYFSKPCKPTKANGNRIRNYAEHNPEKWEDFMSYCKQDVEVERAIKKKVSVYRIPEFEKKLWYLDQEINDRGVLMDTEMIRHAIACDTYNTDKLTVQAKALTGLDNPNSVAQLKNWIEDKTGDAIGSLDKAAVQDLLKTTTDPMVKDALTLRVQMAKTSVKKYEAMERALCEDKRIRGLLQYYGANRTGRWCLTGDHEILTKSGWKRLDEWPGSEIACWNPKGEILSFQQAESVSFDYDDEIYEYSDKRIDQVSTPDHKMYVKRRYGAPWQVDTVENMAAYRPSIPFTGFRTVNASLAHNQLRILVMIQADGHYTTDGSIKLKFIKQRKIERCRSLLRRAGIMYSENNECAGTKMATKFTVSSRHVPLWLRLFRDKTFGPWLFDESADVFFDELVHWDGYQSAVNSIQYSTCNKQNADMIQAFAHLSGRSALIKVKQRNKEHPNWSDAYYVDIWLTPKNCHEIKAKPKISHYSGKVYCAITSTGFFMTRRNGRVWITGNSGRQVQVQNLPQNKIPDLDTARSVLKSGDYEMLELLYNSIGDTLSQLVRTAFIASPGNRFIVADFSAIEARVIAWMAGERWRLDVFSTHGKIYEASAAQMFKVPVESITKDNPLRQKGKIAELALGYQGSTGALIQMGALDMGLTEDELPDLVESWRAANPKIVRFWKTVESAAIKAVEEKTSIEIQYGIRFIYEKGALFIKLPSGRRLSYMKVKLETEGQWNRKVVTYEGMNQTTKKWKKIPTYGGRLVENIVQATARDCLAEAITAVTEAGYNIAMHIHDEVVIDAPYKDGDVEEINAIMSRSLSWAPGLPLTADAYETIYYKKD